MNRAYLLAAGALLLVGCAHETQDPKVPEPCPPTVLADIESRYTLAMLAACGGRYPSRAECPDTPRIEQEREDAQEAARCR